MRTHNIQPTVHIGQVIKNALVFNPKNWRGNGVNYGSIPNSVSQLFAVLNERQVDYVLVGGVALLQYIEGRNTEGIDLIMALPALKTLPEIEIVSQDINFARGKFGELQIYLLLTST